MPSRSFIKMTPTEEQEQRTVVEWLTLKRYVFCSVPNEGNRGKVQTGRLKAAGLQPGFPDLLIFSRSEFLMDQGFVGVAIEMKSKTGKLRKNQKEWLVKLIAQGWKAAVCYGANEAIDFLEELGY